MQMNTWLRPGLGEWVGPWALEEEAGSQEEVI